jgi:alpha-L-fucosidase
MKKIFLLPGFMLIWASLVMAQSLSHPPRPSRSQLQWQNMEFCFFMHFGPNTFTGREWGEGTEQEQLFDPSKLDCNQWCRIAKAAGAKGIVITAKHHDGFCLWPSRFSSHTVRESKWKNGKGDVLRELSAACKKYKLNFGVYISPWDRNHPDYGTAKYNDVFVNMLKELFTHYGPIRELWWDGANGEGPGGKKQVYDWHRFEKTVRELSPRTVIFSDIGPDIRWCGNENGMAGTTNWNTLDTAGYTRGAGAPPQDTLNSGNVNGKTWIPAECDVSIRPGWFYHETEDGKVKSPEQLFDLYLKSVGRGANLLLNVPPDKRGLVSAQDSTSLLGFRKLRDQNFFKDRVQNASVSLLRGGKVKIAGLFKNKRTGHALVSIDDPGRELIRVRFKKRIGINCVVIKEDVASGQSVQEFEIRLGKIKDPVIHGYTTVGRKRILTFPVVRTHELRIHFIKAKQRIRIIGVEAYCIGEKLVEK